MTFRFRRPPEKYPKPKLKRKQIVKNKKEQSRTGQQSPYQKPGTSAEKPIENPKKPKKSFSPSPHESSEKLTCSPTEDQNMTEANVQCSPLFLQTYRLIRKGIADGQRNDDIIEDLAQQGYTISEKELNEYIDIIGEKRIEEHLRRAPFKSLFMIDKLTDFANRFCDQGKSMAVVQLCKMIIKLKKIDLDSQEEIVQSQNDEFDNMSEEELIKCINDRIKHLNLEEN